MELSKLKSTVGLVGKDGVMLKDESLFDKGEMVVVLSVESFEYFLAELKTIEENVKKSREWINEIKKIKGK